MASKLDGHTHKHSQPLSLSHSHTRCAQFIQGAWDASKTAQSVKKDMVQVRRLQQQEEGAASRLHAAGLAAGLCCAPWHLLVGPRTPRTAAQAQRHRVLRWRYEATASGAQLLLPAPKSS